MTGTKIRIFDDPELRKELDQEYEASSKEELWLYGRELAKHILAMVQLSEEAEDAVKEGFLISEQCLKGNARIHDLRQAGFKIHRLAKECEDVILKAALRTAGQAVSVAHMEEHAMAASDYAVKLINLVHPDDSEAVKQERLWQLRTLREVRRTMSLEGEKN